jgi:hypothetical protein
MDLQLPTRRKPAETGFDTNPDVLSAWVNDLPLTDTRKSRKLLGEALHQMNTTDIPPKTRYNALELLSSSVMCVADSMKRDFLTKSIPLQGNNLLLATQTVELFNQMATGYRILTDDQGRDDSQTSRLTVAIHRSLRYLSEVLLTNYQLYIQYPTSLWRTINSLYALAEEYDITTQAISDSTLSSTPRSSIGAVYKQILLLSLACPYRLRQKEIHFVYNALTDWADNSRLYHMDSSHTQGLFAINLNADDPPAYLALLDSSTAGNQWRILDTTSMADRIRSILDTRPENAGRYTGIGDSDILQRLMLAWGVMPKRRFARHPKSAHVGLVVGLNAVHQCIMNPDIDNAGKDDIIEDQHYLRDPTFEASTTFETKTPGSGGRRLVTAENSQPQEHRSERPDETSRIESWKMTNFSAGGYCLLWDSTEASSARVGELVAILEHNNPGEDDWQLGVVRWMKNSTADGLELGIQMLSPSGQAVWAYQDANGVGSGSRMQGILLPEIKTLGQQASLLLPTLPFRAGCLASLLTPDVQNNIKLTRQLESTGSFAQYHFSSAVNA